MEKKVSVIMSTYNTNKEFLKCAIESILNQDYNNFEFIIIIDGGNDFDIINSYDDKRIIVIKHDKSKGLPTSLNEAIKISKGDYIARMDSDDISLPFRLSSQVAYMESNSKVDICGTFYKYFDDDSKYKINVLNSCEEVKAQLFSKNALAHPSVMIRASFLKKFDLLYSEEYKYSQDFDLWTRACEFGNITILPKICFLYRIHKCQISSNKKQEQMALYENILKRNLNRLNLAEENIKYLKMLNSTEKIDFSGLYDFIQLAINENNLIKFYDVDIFQNVLYNFYFLLILKNHYIVKYTFSKKVFKIWNIYNIKFLIKKSYYLFKEKLFLKFRMDGVRIYE